MRKIRYFWLKFQWQWLEHKKMLIHYYIPIKSVITSLFLCLYFVHRYGTKWMKIYERWLKLDIVKANIRNKKKYIELSYAIADLAEKTGMSQHEIKNLTGFHDLDWRVKKEKK